MNILPTGVDQGRISPHLTRPSHRGFEFTSLSRTESCVLDFSLR